MTRQIEPCCDELDAGNHEYGTDQKDLNMMGHTNVKILISTDCYLFNIGGITASVLALCNGLRRLGHEVKTLSLSNCNQSFRDGDDYFIKSFPAFYYPGMRISYAMRDPLLKELEEWKPDLIHIQTEGSPRRMSLRISKHSGAVIVMTCHTDYGHFVFGKYKSLPSVKVIMSAAGKILYRQAAKVTVPSRKAADFPFLKSVQDRLTVVPNGMEMEKYQKHLPNDERRALRAALGIGDNTGTLVTVSRLSKEKNIGELISFLPGLLKKDMDIRLLIVGDGPYKKKLEKQAEKLQLRDSVIFSGRIPAEDVWRYYDAGDLLVSASTFEVHSMSYLEALASGLPLLCRADDSLTGVLEHNENGMTFHNKTEFTDFAFQILHQKKLREEMGRCSLRKAESFTGDAFASSMAAVYEEAINHSDKSAKLSAYRRRRQ